MNRVELELKVNEGRDCLLHTYGDLNDEQLRRPLTTSQHDPENQWTALDHLAHLALIERNFATMVQRRLKGNANPVGLLNGEAGQPRSRADIMVLVHVTTEEWQGTHHHDTYTEVVALTGAARGATLTLVAELSDEQLEETLPGASWADGTICGALSANADHGRTHWQWVLDAGLLA